MLVCFLWFYIYIYYLIKGNLLITEVANGPEISREACALGLHHHHGEVGPSFGTIACKHTNPYKYEQAGDELSQAQAE